MPPFGKKMRPLVVLSLGGLLIYAIYKYYQVEKAVKGLLVGR